MTLLALWILLLLFFLLIIISLLPITFRAAFSLLENRRSYTVSLHWVWQAFGVAVQKDSQGFCVKVLFGNRSIFEKRKASRKSKANKRSTRKGEEEQEKTGKTKGKKKRKTASERQWKIIDLLYERQLLRQCIDAALSFMGDMRSGIRHLHLSGELEIGFSDPFLMGILVGFLYAISPAGMMLDRLRIIPNYVDDVLTGETSLSVSILPASIGVATMKLIFRLPKRYLLKLRKRRSNPPSSETVLTTLEEVN